MTDDRTGSVATGAGGTGAAERRANRPPAGADARLVHCLAACIDDLNGDVQGARIFGFLTSRDLHIVADLRRAAAWVGAHPGGVGTLRAQGLDARDPVALERLPRLAIAGALGRLYRSGALGMPTFEHPANAALVEALHREVVTRVRDHIRVDDLEERARLALAGAPPAPGMEPLAGLVEQLAGRPIGDEKDVVAMALELALEGP